jgi:hypothetical protein
MKLLRRSSHIEMIDILEILLHLSTDVQTMGQLAFCGWFCALLTKVCGGLDPKPL